MYIYSHVNHRIVRFLRHGDWRVYGIGRRRAGGRACAAANFCQRRYFPSTPGEPLRSIPHIIILYTTCMYAYIALVRINPSSENILTKYRMNIVKTISLMPHKRHRAEYKLLLTQRVYCSAYTVHPRDVCEDNIL